MSPVVVPKKAKREIASKPAKLRPSVHHRLAMYAALHDCTLDAAIDLLLQKEGK